MKYYHSDEHSGVMRVDVSKNQSFWKNTGGKEILMSPHSKTGTDTFIENHQISKAEYDKF